MDPEKIQKHLNVFHNLLIDILRRRELFRIFEENLKGKATEDVVKKNWFISFYITDYARAQATDLRKFFETDEASYKIKSLTDHLGDKGIAGVHKKIFEHWKEKFEKPANKLIMHIDQGSEGIPTVFKKQEIDQLINDTNTFFDSIVNAFGKQDKIVFDKKYRDQNDNFLSAEAKREFAEYLKIICS